jgi:hypothetical protein
MYDGIFLVVHQVPHVYLVFSSVSLCVVLQLTRVTTTAGTACVICDVNGFNSSGMQHGACCEVVSEVSIMP